MAHVPDRKRREHGQRDAPSGMVPCLFDPGRDRQNKSVAFRVLSERISRNEQGAVAETERDEHMRKKTVASDFCVTSLVATIAGVLAAALPCASAADVFVEDVQHVTAQDNAISDQTAKS
jgi:hypothetical protein